MGHKLKIIVLIFVLCTSYIQCALNSEGKSVANSNNKFTGKIYELIRGNKNANLIFSPLGISTMMGMTLAGSNGKTKEEIIDGMSYQLGPPDIFEGYKYLFESLMTSAEENILEFGNIMYVQNGFKLQKKFTDILDSNFNSTAQIEDFSKSDKAAKNINKWIETKTRAKITQVVKPSDINLNTVLILINTIYFKAVWEYQFDRKNTAPMPFKVSKDEEIKVPTMNLHEKRMHFAKVPALGATVCGLPYKNKGNDKLAMFIMLPKLGTTLTSLEQKLKNFDFLTIKLSRIPVTISLPKFKITTTLDLIPPLKELKMSSMFHADQADLSGITVGGEKENPKKLYVSKIVQKAFIDVNEDGTEAAAVTMSQISARAMEIPETFIVDRPFFFYIMDVEAKTVIFAGSVVNPLIT